MSLKQVVYHIDSKSRNTGSASNFRLRLNDVIENIRSIKLLSASIPNAQYIVDSTNNTFTLVEFKSSSPTGLSALAAITFPVGNYTPATFATQLATLLTANSPQGWTYTVTFDTTTYKLTISENGAYEFQLQFPNDWLSKHLGFASLTPTSTNMALTADTLVDFIRTREYLIYLRNVYSPNKTCAGLTFHFAIPNHSGFGCYSFFNETSNYESTVGHSNSNVNIGFLDIILMDYLGNEINLNGLDWSFVVSFVTQ